jgi:hypothetical protein
VSGSSRDVHNAQVQLLATLVNNTALGFIGAGFIVPAVNGQPSWFAPIWIACGVGLHYAARRILRRLR